MQIMAFVPDAVLKNCSTTMRYFVAVERIAATKTLPCANVRVAAALYLIEYEVDTLYLDPEDLARRVGINIGVSGFTCEKCAGDFPPNTPWIGKKAPESMQVTWKDLELSPWRWVTAKTAPGGR